MSTGCSIKSGHNDLAFETDMAELTPYLLASYEHEETAPFIISPILSSVMMTA
jgi:hypothetical protein